MLEKCPLKYTLTRNLDFLDPRKMVEESTKEQCEVKLKNVLRVVVVVVSQFNGTLTPKGSYSAKTGDNDFNVNSSRYSLRTAL